MYEKIKRRYEKKKAKGKAKRKDMTSARELTIVFDKNNKPVVANSFERSVAEVMRELRTSNSHYPEDDGELYDCPDVIGDMNKQYQRWLDGNALTWL